MILMNATILIQILKKNKNLTFQPIIPLTLINTNSKILKLSRK